MKSKKVFQVLTAFIVVMVFSVLAAHANVASDGTGKEVSVDVLQKAGQALVDFFHKIFG